MYSPLLRIMRSGSRFEELKDFLVLFGCEIGADAHMHHDFFPLGRAVVAGRSYVVTTHAIVRPEFRSAFSSRSGSDLSGLLIGGATDKPGQRPAESNDRGSGQADPFADF